MGDTPFLFRSGFSRTLRGGPTPDSRVVDGTGVGESTYQTTLENSLTIRFELNS